MPGQPSRVGVDRQDRGEEQIVAALGTAQRFRIDRRIAGADVKQVQLWIIDHRIPDGATTTDLPQAFGVPGFRRHFQFGMLERLGRVAGDGEEPPFEFAGLQVISADITPGVKIRAAIADHHDIARHARCPGRGVEPLVIDDRVGLPDRFAALGVQSKHPPIDQGDVDQPIPDRQTAIDGVTTGIGHRLTRDLGFERPALLPGGGIHRVDLADRSGSVKHAIDHNRRCLQPARGTRFECPSMAQLTDIVCVDLVERREMAFVKSTTRGRPVRRRLG